MKNFIVIAILALGLTGCAALGTIAVDTCETALGGSQAEALCDTIADAIAKKAATAE